jgi:hypothetical protein
VVCTADCEWVKNFSGVDAKKSSFIGSSTACIRWRAPATDELQRSGCKKSSFTGFSTACSRWCPPASEKGKELQRSAKRERERASEEENGEETRERRRDLHSSDVVSEVVLV